jgi:hypothetical protein
LTRGQCTLFALSDRLEILIGKWVNVCKTEPMGDDPPLDIVTSDIYEWLPGGYFILHQAYGRLGNMDVHAAFPFLQVMSEL